MTTRTLTYEDASSLTRAVEFRLPPSGQLFDFDDDTFKASGHTTDSLAMTPVALETGRALYAVDFDDARLDLSASRRSVLFRIVDGSGDGVSEFSELTFDESASELGGSGPVIVHVTPNFDGDLGDDLHVTVRASRGGRPYSLASANNVRVEVREHSEGASTKLLSSTDFSATGTALYNDGQYEASATTPGFAASKIYTCKAIVEIDGVDIESREEVCT